jgi:hypothetical protein
MSRGDFADDKRKVWLLQGGYALGKNAGNQDLD